MTSLTDPSEALARFAAELEFAAIPETVVAAAKRACVDSFAVALAGGTAPGVKGVLDEVRGWGGRAEATVIGSSEGKIPATYAALCNGLQIHARDFDDTHDRAVVHPSACVLPAVLAAAERRGGVSGREFIAALIAGSEIACRIGASLGESLAFERTTICGVFGAAAGAGRILGLSPDGLRTALGIAFSYAGGTRQGLADGALTKRLQPGLAARGGLEAALWAAGGMTGPRNVFSGPSGFFAAFGGMKGDGEVLAGGLGSRFESASVGFKPYPCCRYVHPAIDAALKLCEMGPLPQDSISEVFVSVPPVKSLDYVSRSFPLEGATTVDRQFSLSYVVAAALLRGEVVLDDFDERELPPELSALIGRVHIRRQEKPDSETFFLPAVVTVRDASGERSARCERLKGSPSWPMSDEEFRAKMRDCLNAGDRPLVGQEFWELTALIEEIGDVREIAACWEASKIGTV